MPDYAREREIMVQTQLGARGIKDQHVLAAMHDVPREAFVDPGSEDLAYADGALRIGTGQTISQPYIVALMIEAAEIKPGDRVLEVGAGSGYAAAVMSRIAAQVSAIERHAVLAKQAQARFDRLGYTNIQLQVGDGSSGWPEPEAFDAIIVSASGPAIPRALRDQLRPDGRLVMPVGAPRGEQRLLKLVRIGEDEFRTSDLGLVAFVPLLGRNGWPDS